MDYGTPGTIAFAGRYNGTTGALKGSGFKALAAVHNGAGDNTVALGEAIDINDVAITVTSEGATVLLFSYVIVDDTHVQVLGHSDAGVATNGDFSIIGVRTDIG